MSATQTGARASREAGGRYEAKQCAVCPSVFAGRATDLTCSEECRNKLRGRRDAARYARRQAEKGPILRECLHCKKTFEIPRGGVSRGPGYCSEPCRVQGARDRANALQREKRGTVPGRKRGRPRKDRSDGLNLARTVPGGRLNLARPPAVIPTHLPGPKAPDQSARAHPNEIPMSAPARNRSPGDKSPEARAGADAPPAPPIPESVRHFAVLVESCATGREADAAYQRLAFAYHERADPAEKKAVKYLMTLARNRVQGLAA